MFGSIWSFVKRHRRKFLFAGVLVGGVVLLGKFAKKKLVEYQEKEAAEYLAQFRRQHHFDSNQRNCITTVLSLLPRLREALCHQLNSEALTTQLRTRPTNKLEIWEELKIISFTRAIVAVYSSTMLAVYLRVQLNILGGYMYRDSLSGHPAPTAVVATADVQKHYLAGVQYLFEQGLTDLIDSVQLAVREVLSQVSLRESMSSAHVSELIQQVRRRVESRQQNGCHNMMPDNLCRFIMSPTSATGSCEQAAYLTREEIVTNRLFNETFDILNSQDFQMVLGGCLDTGFKWLLGRISEYFKPVPNGTNGISGIVCMGSEVAMPLAKVIPIANGMVHTVLADAPNPFVQELLLKDDVKNFAINVYNAFCDDLQPGNGCGIG
jgi:peroxin-3